MIVAGAMRSTVCKRQRAQIIVVAPFAIIALVSILGLVVDFGMFRLIDSELENAADAAALAAVWYTPVCPTTDLRCATDNGQPNKTAPQVATQFAQSNLGLARALCGTDPTIDPHIQPIQQPSTTAVTVIIQCDAHYLAGSILGLRQTQITRWATAAIGDKDPVTGKMGSYVAPPAGSASLIAGLMLL